MPVSVTLLQVLAAMLRLYSLMLVVYALISWVMHEQHYPPAVRWLQSMVEPVLSRIRKAVSYTHLTLPTIYSV